MPEKVNPRAGPSSLERMVRPITKPVFVKVERITYPIFRRDDGSEYTIKEGREESVSRKQLYHQMRPMSPWVRARCFPEQPDLLEDAPLSLCLLRRQPRTVCTSLYRRLRHGIHLLSEVALYLVWRG